MTDPTPEERPSRLPSLGPPGSRRRRAIFFAVTGTLLVALLFVFRGVLAPFALGLVVAYVFAPVANAMMRVRIGGRSLPKWMAVVIIYVVLLGTLSAAVAIAAPRLVAETQRLASEAPAAIRTVQEEWIPRFEAALERASSFGATETPAVVPVDEPKARESIRVQPHLDGGYEIHLPTDGITITPTGDEEWRISVSPPRHRGEGGDLGRVLSETIQRAFKDTERYAGTVVRHVQTLATKLVGGVFTFFIMLMISAYMLITSNQIIAFFRSLARPDRRPRFDELVARIDRGLAGVVRGQLLIALVNGVLSGIGFWMADLRYWPILTLFATVLSVIPIFGAIISSIPAILVGLQDGFGTAVFVLVWILGIHQLEANLLNPKIMGDAAKVHPVLVVFALLAGEHLFGIAGALLAVPVLSITQSVFLHFREVALGIPRDASASSSDDGAAPLGGEG